MEQIVIQNLSFSYATTAQQALFDLSLSINKGDFVLLCGETGSGKSTLLRLLKPEIAPKGTLQGNIYVDAAPIKEQSQNTAFVFFNPDGAAVTDLVYTELAFGAESMGMSSEKIRLKVAEVADYFGLTPLFYRKISTLSGGQKQLVNLAASLVCDPDILLLDEPTASLDPLAAADFISVIAGINRDFGVSIIISEHKTKQLLGFANRVVILDKGSIVFDDTPDKLGQVQPRYLQDMPSFVRLFSACKQSGPTPLSLPQAKIAAAHLLHPHIFQDENSKSLPVMLQCKNVYFGYEKKTPVLNDFNFTLKKGECYCLLGGNGAGKSTLLGLLSGSYKAPLGNISIHGNVALLPQNPELLFVCDQVLSDLLLIAPMDMCLKAAKHFDIVDLLNRHPYDLSGGQLAACALCKLFLTDAAIFLLDEPTKGLDEQHKQNLAKTLKGLCELGKSVLLVSHDTEFCATVAHRCGLLFLGNILAENTPRAFFSQNRYYTTLPCAYTQEILQGAITHEDVLQCIKN